MPISQKANNMNPDNYDPVLRQLTGVVVQCPHARPLFSLVHADTLRMRTSPGAARVKERSGPWEGLDEIEPDSSCPVFQCPTGVAVTGCHLPAPTRSRWSRVRPLPEIARDRERSGLGESLELASCPKCGKRKIRRRKGRLKQCPHCGPFGTPPSREAL